jgi:hypothetical protein
MRIRDVIILAPEQVTYLPGKPLIRFGQPPPQQEVSAAVESAGGVDGLLAALRQRHARAHRGLPRLEIRLVRPLVQVRELTGLPPVSEPDLKRLVAQRAEQFFRRDLRPACTDAVWIGKPDSNAPRPALAAAADPELLATLEAGAETHGWLLDRITVEGSAVERRLRLRSPSGEAAGRRRRRAVARRLLLAALGTAALLPVVAVGRLKLESRVIEARLNTLHEPGEAASNLRKATDEARAMLAAIEQARATHGLLLAPLARVASALPDSAVLSSFALDERGKGELSGHAYRALDVLAALGRLDLGRPQVEGSLTRETASGHNWERFIIRFDVKP